MARADLPAHLDAVTVREAHVEQCDVGTGRRDPVDRLLGGVGFADHLDVVFGFEELPDATAHDLVIVEEEHADRAVGHGGEPIEM